MIFVTRAINCFFDNGRDMSLPIKIRTAKEKGSHAQKNKKTKDNQKRNDQRSPVEDQSPLAVSPGSLQVSDHLHVSCLQQREKKER